jgi:photosystem II stability/assembly factor-like uncharacterized protein
MNHPLIRLACGIGCATVLSLSAAIAGPIGGREDVEAASADTHAARTDSQGRRSFVSDGAAAATSHAVAGDTATWTSIGPGGGDVADVEGSPTAAGVVLAGTAPGGSWGGNLYRSTDGGTTWSTVAQLAGISTHEIAFASDGSVYLATQDSVWTSDDDGLTWTQRDLGIGVNDEAFAVAVDPVNPDTVWVGITDALGTQSVNLMRSTDGGVTWTDRTPPLAGPMIGDGIAIAPEDPDTVIAVFGGGLGGGAVWVTTDGGDTWQDRSAGLPGNPMRSVVYDGTRLLVGGGQLFGSQYVGVYASADLGATWQALHDGTWPLLVATSIAVDPDDAQTILVATDGAGVNRTTDGGATWVTGIGGGLAVQSVQFDPAAADWVFAGTTSLGAFRSSDGGASFTASTTGIHELALFSIAANPLNPNEIAVAYQGNNSGGVYGSTNGGGSWTREAGLPGTRYSKVGFAPDGTLYAISSGPSSIAPEGLYRRESDATWTSLGPDQGNLFESDLKSLHFSQNDPDLILLGGGDFGVAGFAGTIWRSTDAGVTWTKVYLGPDFDVITDFEIIEDGTDQTVVAAYDGQTDPQQGGVLRSVDGGASFQVSNAGLPAFARVPRLCASSGDPQSMHLSIQGDGNAGLVYETADAGANWTASGWSGDHITDIACDPLDDNVLYIAQYGVDRVARSEDGGATFAAFADGLESAGAPAELCVAGSVGSETQLLLATGNGSYTTGTPVSDTIFADGFDATP